MITLARASALTATAFTAAAVVITLRTPEHGGAASVPVYVAPAASQVASPASRSRPSPSGPGPGGHDGVIAFNAASGRWHSHRRVGSGCGPP
jgi:hypothetical protein